MTEQTTHVTEMEKALLIAMTTNEYTNGTEDSWGQWTFAVIAESGIDPKQARGALSSLIQKGLVTEYDNGLNGAKGRSEDFCLSFTPEGLTLVKEILAAIAWERSLSAAECPGERVLPI
jgi:hypothetical protein